MASKIDISVENKSKSIHLQAGQCSLKKPSQRAINHFDAQNILINNKSLGLARDTIANKMSTDTSAILRKGERSKIEEAAKNNDLLGQLLGKGSTNVENETERFVKAIGEKVYHPTGNRNVVYGKTAQAIVHKLPTNYADVLILKQGATIESVATNIEHVLGKRALRNRSHAAMSLLSDKLKGKVTGDIIDISVFARVGLKETLKANKATKLRNLSNSALQENSKTKAFAYTIAANAKETFNNANDKSAPDYVRSQARRDIINEVGFSVAPVGWLVKGKTLANVIRTGSADFHAQSAAKITFDATLNELDKVFANQTGKIISKNPVAKASYDRLLKQGTEVRMVRDSSMDEMGVFYAYKNQVIINLDKHTSSKEVASTLVHEATHQKRHFQVSPKNTQYEEYLSFRNEFLFKKLRRPTFVDRKDIWNDVQEFYPHLETGKIPFKGIDQ